jgi:hypothetical protein
MRVRSAAVAAAAAAAAAADTYRPNDRQGNALPTCAMDHRHHWQPA